MTTYTYFNFGKGGAVHYDAVDINSAATFAVQSYSLGPARVLSDYVQRGDSLLYSSSSNVQSIDGLDESGAIYGRVYKQVNETQGSYSGYVLTPNGSDYNHGSFVTYDVPFSSGAYPAYTDVTGVSGSGTIAGVFRQDGIDHGFVKVGAVYARVDYPGAVSTDVTGIDSHDGVFGYYSDGARTHGFLTSNGSLTSFDVPGATSTRIEDINSYGQIVGSFVDSAGTPHGFVSTSGIVSTLSVSNAGGISESGQIVGDSYIMTEHVNAIYRFYDRSTGDHFYTADPAEKASIQANTPGLVYEGAPWATPDKGPNTIDVFRFYDTSTRAHFFTSSTAERDSIMKNLPTYTYEGVAFQAYAQTENSGDFALERFYNSISHVHTYAADANEIALIKSGQVGQGWVDEGPSFIVHHPTADMLIA